MFLSKTLSFSSHKFCRPHKFFRSTKMIFRALLSHYEKLSQITSALDPQNKNNFLPKAPLESTSGRSAKNNRSQNSRKRDLLGGNEVESATPCPLNPLLHKCLSTIVTSKNQNFVPQQLPGLIKKCVSYNFHK